MLDMDMKIPRKRQQKTNAFKGRSFPIGAFLANVPFQSNAFQ